MCKQNKNRQRGDKMCGDRKYVLNGTKLVDDPMTVSASKLDTYIGDELVSEGNGHGIWEWNQLQTMISSCVCQNFDRITDGC